MASFLGMCVVCSRTVALQRCNAPCPQIPDSSDSPFQFFTFSPFHLFTFSPFLTFG